MSNKNKNNKNKSGAIVKLVIWSVVLVALVTVLTVSLVLNSGALNGIQIGFGSGFSVVSSYTYDNADMYSAGNASFSDEVTRLDIEWTAGELKLVVYSGDEIKVEESGAGKLDENKLRTYLDNGTLHIRYAKSGIRWFRDVPTKELTVYLPEECAMALDEIEIKAVSANVSSQGGIVCRELDVEAVSGKINLTEICVQKAEFNTVSGNITVAGEVSELDVEAVSAKLCLTLKSIPRSINVESISGNIELTLPDTDEGFRAELESLSGAMKVGNENVGTVYKHNAGNASFSFESVSGNVKIIFKDQ